MVRRKEKEEKEKRWEIAERKKKVEKIDQRGSQNITLDRCERESCYGRVRECEKYEYAMDSSEIRKEEGRSKTFYFLDEEADLAR